MIFDIPIHDRNYPYRPGYTHSNCKLVQITHTYSDVPYKFKMTHIYLESTVYTQITCIYFDHPYIPEYTHPYSELV